MSFELDNQEIYSKQNNIESTLGNISNVASTSQLNVQSLPTHLTTTTSTSTTDNNNNDNNKTSTILNGNLYNLRKIFFKNIPLDLRIDDIYILISSLTKQKPISVDFITNKDNYLAVYLVIFEQDLGNFIYLMY